MKFIGHLDMMRYFQKAIRRAEIDICYSEGFSPHMIMSFAAPLGVGITSDGEYFDIEVNSTFSSKEAIERLNRVGVEGVEVTDYVELPAQAKTAMSIVHAADYKITFKEGYSSIYSAEEWKKLLQKYVFDANEFTIMKKTKKSEREVDLKPLIYDCQMDSLEDQPVFFIKVSSGSVDNIKPELILSAILEKEGMVLDENAIQIHRTEVYTRLEDGTFLPLSDMGKVIE